MHSCPFFLQSVCSDSSCHSKKIPLKEESKADKEDEEQNKEQVDSIGTELKSLKDKATNSVSELKAKSSEGKMEIVGANTEEVSQVEVPPEEARKRKEAVSGSKKKAKSKKKEKEEVVCNICYMLYERKKHEKCVSKLNLK